jgi:hypothetical protein
MPFCTCTDAGLITVTDDPACTRSGAAQLAPIDNASSGKPRPPTLLFYIRDYYTVPDIDIADWSLSIDGAVFDPAPP